MATDIAARGIDVLSISHVINYDMPESTDDYIHRIGRTGRVDKNGEALTFVTNADADKIRALERLLDAPLERMTLQGFDYTKPAPDKEPRLSQQPRRRFGCVTRRQAMGKQAAKTARTDIRYVQQRSKGSLIREDGG